MGVGWCAEIKKSGEGDEAPLAEGDSLVHNGVRDAGPRLGEQHQGGRRDSVWQSWDGCDAHETGGGGMVMRTSRPSTRLERSLTWQNEG